jgi:GT2 family glycosyltransferase/tetratricopeptide (TPR) repeat protein
MDSSGFGPSPLESAWRHFADGDLAGAIRLAGQAAAVHPAPVPACASLGFFLMQDSRNDEAAAVLLPACARAPDYGPLQWYLGYLRQRRGDLVGAVACFERACELDPRLDEAAYALAWALHDLGRLDAAQRWAARALAQGRSPGRLLQCGWLQQAQGHFEAAVRLYRESIAAFDLGAPEQPRLQLHLSQCLLRLGLADDADAVLRGARLRWPEDTLLMAGAAWALRDGGDPHGALRLADELVRRHPDRAAGWHLQGVLLQDAGKLEQADASLLRAQDLDVGLTDALLRRAQIHHAWKRFAGARWLLGLVLDRAPGDRAACDLLIQVHLDLEEVDAARRLLLPRLRASRTAGLWRLLAVTQSRRGRVHAAQRSLGWALTREPGHVETLRLLGWLALELGDSARAVALVRELMALAPDDVAAQVQAAFALVQAGQVGEAQACAERAVACAPGQSEAWRALSQVRLRQQRLGEAQAAVLQGLRLAPGDRECLRQLGNVLLAGSRHGQAQLAFMKILEDEPGHPAVTLELAEVRRRAGQFAAGLDALVPLLRARPGWYPALLARVRLLAEGGLAGADDACAEVLRRDRHCADGVRVALRLVGLGSEPARRLLSLVPADLLRRTWREAIIAAVHTQGQPCLARLVQVARADLDEDGWIETAALYAASLSSRAEPEALALQSRHWYRSLKLRNGLNRLPLAQRAATMDGRLRIAYVAGQLHESLLRRVLAAHEPQQAQVFVYTNQPWTGLPAHVHLQPLVPATLAESCAANRIDVLIDAGGLHPFEGQFELLQAYARRLAPVQVGWLGCWGSAGGLFDALLADETAIPPQHEAQYEEAVLRVTGGHWCWDPPLVVPEVGPLPALGRGSITYGVTARSLRLDDACLDAFARVVAATPQAVIRFIGEIALDWPTRRDVLARMQAQGVSAGRVFFDPFAPQTEYLAWLGRVDIVLDSFPGNGGLSLLDPLWMGVPVVTLAGAWAGARQGASLLAALGLAQWGAESEADFCAVAVALARDPVALAGHRASLRERVLASPLVDGRRVASQIESLCARLKQDSAAAAVAADPKERSKAQAQAALETWLALPRTIDLPAPSAGVPPELSVIVVLFNQAGLSRRTLQALADQRGAGFETIVVDNASADRTPELLERLRSARIIRNPDNRGFLQAARQGAGVARGRYLVFLNSDAILQEGALAATLRALREDPGIGALGGRIVLTDGGLQEAGNMVFRDGSTGGIGRGEDAFGHAARAARATDYVSGVFLATPASLWRMLGGFDEAFAPAYYEDTDYCLRVWQAGFRVVYEPSVLLEHLEWGSATGDSATVLMKRNREVFRVRYADWLQNQPRPQSPTLALDADRWRSPDDLPRRPRVLFLDNEVPHMHRGGGLPRARLMLQALRDWPVTLFPLWNPHDDWRAVYASLPGSVEVAMGYGMAGLEGFLERRRGVYDVLVVSRPPNLQALQPLWQRRPELFAGIRLIYDAEALFALREIAMAGVQGRPLPRAAARGRIDAELALAAGASDVLVVSQRDARHFEAAGHRTHVLSHAIAPRRAAPGVAGRSGLLFVGALHPGTPNEDGLLWFVREVMPLLRRWLAAPPVLTVVGVCLSDQVAALAGADVRVLGSQETLEPHYDAARVFIAPVRFAGGVPAKVIEAVAGGVPAVASALLVRQLQWRDGLDVLGARDASAFAAAIMRLLQDDALWQRQQFAGWDQCGLRYAPEVFGRTLRSVLAGAPEPGA